MQAINFSTSAQSYGSMLSTLGAVCITILVLIFSLTKELEHKRIKTFLIYALIMATFACFTGAHLLTDILTFRGNSEEFLHFYRIALINVYIAMIYFAFALGLLPRIFEAQLNLNILGTGSSIAMIVIALLFCFANVLSPETKRLGTIEAWTLLILFFIIGIIFFGFPLIDKIAFFVFSPFWLAFLAIGGSASYYALTLGKTVTKSLTLLDHYIFLIATMLPILSLLGLIIRLIKERSLEKTNVKPS
jgi:hypothetical protein